MTDIAAIIKVFMEPALKTDLPAQAALRAGSVLNGRITDVLPGGLLQINFGKFRTQARVRFPVVKGDTLRFEVLDTGDPIKLKIQDPPPAASREPVERFFKPEELLRFRQALEMVLQKPGAPWMDRGSAESIRLLLSRLNTHLLPLPTGRESDRLATHIKSVITGSGIFFEKRLESVLLQIFKAPDRIDTGRAVSHPFVTNIFDNDLKPNLLKLAALLANTGGDREQLPAAIREASLKMLNRIDAEQARLTRRAPTGSARRAGIYHRGDSPPAGLPGKKAPGSASGAVKALHLQLVKSGLWSDPEIRAVARELFKGGGLETDRNASVAPAKKGPTSPGPDRVRPGAASIAREALSKTLAGLIKANTAPQPKALGHLLKAFQAHVHESRFTLDDKTEKALIQMGTIVRQRASRWMPAARGTGSQAADVKQHLRTLARFIDNHPDTPLKITVPGKPVAADSRKAPRMFPGPGADPANTRTAPNAIKRGPQQAMNLAAPKAAALVAALNRLDKALVRALPDSAVHPDITTLARSARALRSLIGRHQLPADDGVNRALTALTTADRTSRPGPSPGSKPGPISERLLQDLAVLREFIGQQRTGLHETLDILRVLVGRTITETDPGDRAGPERARGADPVQVIAFSLPMEEGQKPARLKVFYQPKKRSAAETGFRISLLLSMARMGPIRADIFAHHKHLDIKFSTENEPARLFIDKHLGRLGDFLDAYYDNVNLTAAVDAKTIAAFEYEDLELSDDRLVDLKA